MAYENDQSDFPLPAGGDSNRIRSVNFLPKYFRTEANKKFTNSTIDQMITPGVVEKLNAFAGRRYVKSAKIDDIYLADISPERESYQFEPVTVYKDNLDNVNFLKTYNDYMNQLGIFGGNTSNHSITNRQEFYSWNPHINWDMISNFREYYWLPNGPLSIGIVGQSKEITSTYAVTISDEQDNYAFVISPNGFSKNPLLKLYKGQTYRFEINTPGQPFAITTTRQFIDNDLGYGTDFQNFSFLFKDGITVYEYNTEGKLAVSSKDYIESGVVEITLLDTAPPELFYISKNNLDCSGLINVFEIEENTEINVEEEILGKKTYKTSTGVELSNGMKVYFQGDVTPSKYKEGNWYVDGIGTGIKLVSDKNLQVPSIFTDVYEIPFDVDGFDQLPYEDAASYPLLKDYIVINRSSADRNPWTRYNRWFHRDAIETSATANNVEVVLDQNARATRPIIEFEAGIKLYNHGNKAKQDVNLVDNFTKDVFSIIEGSLGYNVDGVDLVDGMRLLVIADTDILVNGKIYIVNFILHNGRRQIALTEAEDSDPQEGETVLILEGSHRGNMYYYTNQKWNASQEKNSVNQAPLFDIFDNAGNSLSDIVYYNSTNFLGTKLFSYKEGVGNNDSELGFPLSYRTISNIGDIEFEFNILTDIFTYRNDQGVIQTGNTDIGFLKVYNSAGEDFVYQNGWKKTNEQSKQAVIRQYNINDPLIDGLNLFVDVFNNSDLLTDLVIKVFKNGILQFEGIDYDIFGDEQSANGLKIIYFLNDLASGDIVVLKCYSSAPKNQNGFYEIPINYERNPLNANVETFTLGEVNDHVLTILENHPDFNGIFPGVSNLRNIKDPTIYGRRFVQHSGPINLPLYHITDKDSNVIFAIRNARNEYSKFKRNFIDKAENSGFSGNVKDHVDLILEQIKPTNKTSNSFFFSDMIGIGSAKKNTFNVEFNDSIYFQLSQDFSLNSLSSKAVYVYLNNIQLIHGKDYIFLNQFVVLNIPTIVNDVVEIYEYESTNGSYIPPTPSKLGLYPSYEPQIIQDNTYFIETNMIQGHDGSLVKAYGDYRDELILEFEKRIYNNIKNNFNKSILDLFDYIPGYNRNTNLSYVDFNNTMTYDFNQWLESAGLPNFSSHSFFNRDNSFSFNYSQMTGPDDKLLDGFWRKVYKKYFDTDRPHTHPWEMLGFYKKPAWWESVYGPTPYTKDNSILWKDLEEGIIREPNKKIVRNEKFVRPGITKFIPVNENGVLLSPLESGLAKNYTFFNIQKSFNFGDESPVETAWRRSSEYPFSLIASLCILQPAKFISTAFDLSRTVRNLNDIIVYSETQKTIQLDKLVVTNIHTSTEEKLTSGLVNYIVNYLQNQVVDNYEKYVDTLSNISNQLAVKLAGYADKSKLKLVLDSRSPLNKSSVFVPEENYNIVLSQYNAEKIVTYSGIIIEKVQGGYIINGYDRSNPTFNYFAPIPRQNDPSFNVGGVSEALVNWASNQQYAAGLIVRYENKFYRTKETHKSDETFDITKFSQISSVPVVGGISASLRKNYETVISKLNYGTQLSTVQDVVDFLLGYETYLRFEGFKFEFFNKETETFEDMKLCVREFMFWVTQNWQTGTVISISPLANQVLFEKENYVVDDIFDKFYDNNIVTGNGSKLSKELTNVSRTDINKFGIKPINSEDGIYLAKLPLLQKEHLVLIDNQTVFNDIIYDLAPGYRQERIKLIGYRTDGWKGGFDIPGFFYNEVKIKTWTPNTDYQIGDVVKNKEFYYSANNNVVSSDFFNESNWTRLDKKPESELLPNWDYKAVQFTDFYDLDTDNFDIEQQRLGQHLIGYQKREYLSNIITDSVSQYKFYQGFIQEKGTKNALNKLFDALGSSEKDSLEFYEEWALQVGRYGAIDNVKEIEYELDESKYRLEPQLYELKDINRNRTDLVHEIPKYQVYVAPKDYNHNPFEINDTAQTFTKNRGYVRDQDIDFTIDNIDSLVNVNLSELSIGNFIWTTDQDNDWQIYRLVLSDYTVTTIQNELVLESDEDITTEGFRLTFNKYVDIQPNEIVAILSSDRLIYGFFKVHDVKLNVVGFFGAPEIDFEEYSLDSSFIGIARLVKRRFKDAQDTNENIKLLKKDDNDKIWIDSVTDGWSVYENNDTASLLQEILNPTGQGDGFAVSFDMNAYNTLIAIGHTSVDYDQAGSVRIYKRTVESFPAELVQEIFPNDLVSDTANFGQSVSMSEDGKYLAIGAPYASNVKTNFVGNLTEQGSYLKGDIVKDRGVLWRAKQDIPFWVDPLGDLSTIKITDDFWEPVYFIETSVAGVSSGLTNQGAVFIYERQNTGLYSYSTTIVSSNPSNEEKFGWKVQLRQDVNNKLKLFVGAPGEFKVETGKIYALNFEDDLQTWSYATNRNFKGQYSEFTKYTTGDIVYYNGDFFQAQTNLSQGFAVPVSSELWLDIDNTNIEHTGYIPHTNLAILEDNEQGFTPEYTNVGLTFDVNKNGDTIIFSALKLQSSTYRVFVYNNLNDRWTFGQFLDATSNLEDYGYSIAINEQGDQIAVGAPRNDDKVTNGGCVYIYEQDATVDSLQYIEVQKLRSVFNEPNELFGVGVDFDGTKLAIAGKNTDSKYKTTFDNYTGDLEDFIIGYDNNGNPQYADWVNDPYSIQGDETVFDQRFTTFGKGLADTGKIALFEKIGNYYIYGEDVDYARNTKFNDISNFKLNKNHLYVGFPELNAKFNPDDQLFGNYAISEDSSIGILVDLRWDKNSASWKTVADQAGRVDIKKIKKAFLYSKKDNVLLSNLDFIDPRQGKIAGPAEQEINFKTFYDPAIYSNNETDEDENIVQGIIVDANSNWTDQQVGTLWWNISTASWYDAYQGSIQYRSANWNKLAPNSSIDVYEWVSSRLLPSSWAILADTNEGYAQGISGQPLYGDTVYSVKRVYDSFSNTFFDQYYFWVKSKKIIPNRLGRFLTAFDVERLIENPASLGYRFIAFNDSNKFSIYNAKSFIKDKDTVLHIELFDDEELKINVHTEYQLLTENLSFSKPNVDIENKWIDSLIGYDRNYLVVPDPLLSVKQKYGVQNNPRQGMFVNKTEALKQVVERVNQILASNLIVDNYRFDNLNAVDEQPVQSLNFYDVKVDTTEDLDFVGVAKITPAKLIPVVQNTKIVRVIIQDPGRGYKTPPLVTVLDGYGSGAIIQTKINNLGQVISATIKSQGKNYTNNVQLNVRKFSALVSSDSDAIDRWSIFEWDINSQSWNRVRTQSYRTTDYWSYIDWYEEGYSKFTKVNFNVDQSYELFKLNDNIGDIVKINNVGSGGWLLLRKVDDQLVEDYTVNYNTIGRQNGTIKLLDTLYNYPTTLSGYDSDLYDTNLYDSEPIIEIRNIFNALKNDIFIGELEVYWNNLFFTSLRYVLSEQLYVDWLFKTSFVRAKHNLGDLQQKVSFQNDNLENYQDYVNEVKPYSTKIREYIGAYSYTEPTQTLTTDFDLQPSYNIDTKTIEVSNAKLLNNAVVELLDKYNEYPFKSWIDNNGYDIIRIDVADPGQGYLSSPAVTILGDNISTAKAYVSAGKVVEIEITNKGGKYYTAPEIIIEGNISETGRPAKAVAVLGNSHVRNTHLVVKFDRISGTYLVSDLSSTETFTGTGSRLEYILKYPMSLKTENIKIYINNKIQLSSNYSVVNIVDITKTYNRYLGKVTFVNEPEVNAQIRIEYKKDIKLLDAADRINFFYNPTSGMLGKDLPQLMDGIEYQGAVYESIDFGNVQGFDLGGFGSLPWDTFDSTYNDEIFTVDGSTVTFELASPLEDGVEYNVYVKKTTADSFTRIDSPNWDGSTVGEIVMYPIQGDGVTQTVTLPVELGLRDGDMVIIRKETSDGSLTPTAQSFDTQLTGGSFNINSAAGYNPDDIIIDGDGFVTPRTSNGPEELVPGQILDTLDIKVYHKNRDGVGVIGSANYMLDNIEKSYKLPNIPHSNDAIIVKIDNEVIDPGLYFIDWDNLTVELGDSTSTTGSYVNITTLGSNGSELLDTSSAIYENEDIVTNVKWQTEISAFVSVNGRVKEPGIDYELVQTPADDRYPNRVKIKFLMLPTTGDYITYAIYNSTIQTYSQILIDNTFNADGDNFYHKFDGITYPVPFNNQLISHNILVKVNDKFLHPSYSIQYEITGQQVYELENWQFVDITTVTNDDIIVLMDNQQLENTEFTFDPAQGTVKLSTDRVGSILNIYALTDAEYFFVDTKLYVSSTENITDIIQSGDSIELQSVADSTLILNLNVKEVAADYIIVESYNTQFRSFIEQELTEYAYIINATDSARITIQKIQFVISDSLTFTIPPSSGAIVEIYQFSNHDVNNFQRYVRNVFTTVDLIADSQDYFNRNLLTVGIIPLRKTAEESQYAWVFLNGVMLSPNVDYVVNNDLNAVQLKELPKETDTIDIVQFGNPSVGKNFGYRIFKDILNRTHYKRLNQDNSYVLAQPLNYYDNTITLESTVGISQPNKMKNIPGVLFIEGERIEYFNVSNNTVSQLRRGTLGTGTKNVYETGTRLFGQGIEENISYRDDVYEEVIIVNGTESNTVEFNLSSTPANIDELEVIVGGKRMRKTQLAVFDHTISQDSPEADITLPADYTLVNNKLIFANPPAKDIQDTQAIKIQILKKKGSLWTEFDSSLENSQTDISKFIRKATIEPPK